MTERYCAGLLGGLDTSVAIGWIGEATGAEVIAVAVDVGQGGDRWRPSASVPSAAAPSRPTWPTRR